MDSEQGNNIMENIIFLRRWNQQSWVDEQKREGPEAGKSLRRYFTSDRAEAMSTWTSAVAVLKVLVLGSLIYVKMMAGPNKMLLFMWVLSINVYQIWN